jgi:hypothetical protein
MAAKRTAAVDTSAIMGNILVIRGHRVLLDSDLASLYQVETKVLTRAVRRNAKRFPEDFMFRLAAEESGSLRSQSGAFKTGRGKHRKYAPYVFTEPGSVMPVGIVTESSSVVAQIRVDSGYSIANGAVVSRSPTLSLITRKFARQSHPVFSESRNAAFYRLRRSVRLGSIPIARSTQRLCQTGAHAAPITAKSRPV